MERTYVLLPLYHLYVNDKMKGKGHFQGQGSYLHFEYWYMHFQLFTLRVYYTAFYAPTTYNDINVYTLDVSSVWLRCCNNFIPYTFVAVPCS